MNKFKEYLIYIGILIIGSMLGATLSHFYSRDAIRALQEEIDFEKNQSLLSIKNQQSEIDSANILISNAEKLNDALKKSILVEKNNRSKIKPIDSLIKIDTSTDAHILFFQKYLN